MRQTTQHNLFTRLAREAVMLFVVMMTCAQTIWAGPIDETEALKKAQAFLTKHGRGQVLQQKGLRRAPAKGGMQTSVKNDYYLFNLGDEGGFVIVSGDDRTEAILGYADNGSIDEDNMPEGLRYMLDGYAEQMEWLDQQSVKTADPLRAMARKSISPLIRTHWDQGSPYNLYCPEIHDIKTVTGCVATTMAQLMYYHQWPQDACTVIPGYSTTTLDENKESYALELDDLPATTFDWSKMTLNFSNSSSDESKAAVATLMHYCGRSLQMRYGLNSNGGSSAYGISIAEVLKSNFNYDVGIRKAFRENYTYQEWIELIYTELAANRPVALGGQSTGGGHSFICDGYDAGDYFHINWGWSGSSDGYFRLSALNPEEQGIGGSSTLDGFSFGQEAVIGIQPPTGDSWESCLTVAAFSLQSPDNTLSSKVYTRNSETGDFEGINFHLTLESYQFGTNPFDFTVMMFDEKEDTLVKTFSKISNYEIGFNSRTNWKFSNKVIPESIPDGTYSIAVFSLPHNGENYEYWMDCDEMDLFKMTATISGDELTISVPHPDYVKPASANFTINGDCTLGHEQEVIASVTGSTTDYCGNLLLYVGNKLVMGKVVEIPAEQTVDVRFVYTPFEAGENKLYLSRAKSIKPAYVIDSTTVTIQASDASNAQELTIEPTITNLSGEGKLYGNALRVTARVTNPSTEYSYASQLNCSLRKYDTVDADVADYVDATVQHKQITIAKSVSEENLSYTDVTYTYDGLELGKFYRLRFSYQTDKGLGNGPITDIYELGEGYALYAADGTTEIYPLSATIDAGSAVCVDLTGISNLADANITASTNPNCLYQLTSEASVPAALTGKNVVKGTSAAAITLADGYDFYTPKTISAEVINYTRTFTLPANGNSGWSTIVLPFSVSSVTCEDLGTVDWFHSSSDTGKNFWLRSFDSDGEGYVSFDNAGTMTANTPYIIAVPGDRWGDAWRMTDRAVTFSGTDAILSPAIHASTSGNNYSFCGTTVGTSLSNVYLLNNEGTSFVHTSEPTAVPAFRAWFEGVSISSLACPMLSIGKPQATDIDALEITEQTTPSDNCSAWFTLDGRPLSGQPATRGLYIHQGKTILIR